MSKVSVRYTIKSVAALTGLSPHTIRAWERRYGAFNPERTNTNRRLYNDEEVRRLALLARAVGIGHSIGQIADLSLEELERLAGALPERPVSPSSDAQGFVQSCESAIERLDGAALEQELSRAATTLGANPALDQVVVPLLQIIDRRWHEGTFGIAQEHLLSASLRAFLERMRRSAAHLPNARHLLVTTPAGQIHEIGAQLVAAVAALEGWRVTYLGPSLPADDIVFAVRQSRAEALALSVVFPEDDQNLPEELRRIRQEIGPTVRILVGGRAARAYASALADVEAEVIEDLNGLRSLLRSR